MDLLLMTGSDIERRLKVAIALTVLFFVVEIIGSLISGSLSLLGDAGHMFRDIFALLITLSAINLAKKLPTKTKTFGYHRIEIFAALVNGIMLIGISGWIFQEAYIRLLTPHPINSRIMFTVALTGLLVNLYVALTLHGSQDINVRSAFIHVLTDTLSSLAVILASVLIFFTGEMIIDPLLGVGIAAFVLASAIMIIKDALHVLLEFTPKGISFDEIIRDIEEVDGVEDVHDVHLWSLCSNINLIDAHILTNELNLMKVEEIKREIKRRLEKYGIKHATLEFECEACKRNEKVEKMEH
ncbi:MAG: Cation efflux protein [Candidatus Syntrophoarchaeum butanivorans]|uniref:Cation efflux protein n=2 Tax=Candidatus Syntropharchaeum butanivorans TaxID=1839936 RepID=A0A1F2P8E7_9EURY|nr:MAG: Cation efflux protein [Candidatus Syntrophoarchaeum butanivorans]